MLEVGIELFGRIHWITSVESLASMWGGWASWELVVDVDEKKGGPSDDASLRKERGGVGLVG